MVSSVFGPNWARVFCGVEPPPAPAQDPEAYGLLEDPLGLLDLDGADQASREAAAAEPSRSAAIDEEIANGLDAAGFPGHAQVIRRRAAATLLGAGQAADGFEVLYGLARSRLLGGASLDPGLHFQLLTLAGQHVLGQADQARLTLLLAIHNWPSTGSGLAEAAPALAQLHAADDPDIGILACTILEHALVDGIFEHQPPRSLVGECPPGTEDLAQEILCPRRPGQHAGQAMAGADPLRGRRRGTRPRPRGGPGALALFRLLTACQRCVRGTLPAPARPA